MLRILDRHGKDWHADLAVNIRRMIAAEKLPSVVSGPTTAAQDRRRGLRLAADCFYRGSIARDIDAWSIEQAFERRAVRQFGREFRGSFLGSVHEAIAPISISREHFEQIIIKAIPTNAKTIERYSPLSP